MSYVKIGVAGPVGSGKTALIEALPERFPEIGRASCRERV